MRFQPDAYDRGPTGTVSPLRNLGRMTREEVVAVAQRRELGQLIDELGVRQQIDADETVCGAVVLLTVEEPDGHLSLRCAWSDGMTWIERIGLLRAAERAELPADGAHDWRV
jgi:hypothetical protein